ncbi:hypothetical protein FRB96_001355 [Tulasnella sp. 330]|nr:hypothetical protein FRB96_001355 [Tulasnella sp. 330]
MDLSLLRDSLPSANLAQADRDLLDNFKAAALSITTLYKSARTNSKLNYNVGYAACLHDVLNFVQAGVSAEGRMAALGGNDGSGALGIQLNNGDGMTIGMVMDWLENRLDTITSEEEDGEGQFATGTGGGGGAVREEDEPKVSRREKARERNGPAARRTSPRAGRDMGPPPPRTSSSQQATNIIIPTPSPAQLPRSARTLSSSPPSTTLVTPRSTIGQQPSTTRSRTKHRNSVQASSTSASSFTFNVPLPTSTVNPFERDFGSQHLSLSMDQTTDGTTTATGVNENDCPLIMPELPQSLLGTKRRHSTVVSEIPDPSTYGSTTPGGPSSATSRDRNGQANGGGSSKRRNKGNGSASSGASRVLGESQDANAMDVEEGSTTSGEPARKKVARR